MGDLATIIKRKVRQYGSLRDASRKLGVGYVYLHRLSTGEQSNPSDEVLRKLGITRTIRITYKEIA